MNSPMKYSPRVVVAVFLSIMAFTSVTIYAQSQGNRIREIVVESNQTVSSRLIVNQSGLKVGGPLTGDTASQAIRNLWTLGIFRDIRILQEVEGNGIKVIIKVELLPQVNEISVQGYDEFEESDILSATGLVRNMAIGERKIAVMIDKIQAMYREKGYLRTDVDFQMDRAGADSSNYVDVSIVINEGKKYKIKSINIEGNENISDKKIRKIMETKENRWYRSGDFDDNVFKEDKVRIVQLYKSEGYRDAVVVRDSTFYDEDAGRIRLTLFLQEGKQYKFGTTSFEGNSVFEFDILREHVSYIEGEIFNEDLLNQALYEIQVLYNDSGYLKTLIDRVQMAHGDTVDVLIDVAEGTVSNVAKVIIKGNTKTIDKVIRREVFLLPGMPFNRSLLERSRRNVMQLNYFSEVNPDYLIKTDSDDVDLVISVKEKQTGVASMGAGYSERDKLVGTLSFSNSNLFGNGQGVNFDWQVGSRRKAFSIGFSEPWLFDTPTGMSISLYNIIRSDYTTAFDEESRRGGYIRLSRRLSWPDDYSRASVTYRLEDIDYTNPSEYYRYYLVTGKTSSLGFTYSRDSRNHPEFATDGSRTRATLEVAGGPFGGDLNYYKYLFNNEYYTPVWWQVSFIVRTRLGFLKGYSTDTWVPYSERFMPGGTSYDGFVRGYPTRMVSPLLEGEEIGGETMLVTNLELQFPVVSQMIYGILFYDFGNAWEKLAVTNPFEVKRSAGIGVRVGIPGLGNLGFDFGYGFDRLESTGDIGGWRTHFQFGNQFW